MRINGFRMVRQKIRQKGTPLAKALPCMLSILLVILLMACKQQSEEPVDDALPHPLSTLYGNSSPTITRTPTSTHTSIPSPSPSLMVLPSSTPNSTATPIVTAIPPEGNQYLHCPGAPETSLNVDTWARANTESAFPNLVRSHAALSAEIMGKIQPGELVLVADGPRCADGYNWWFVLSVDGLEGWIAEGEEAVYSLVPLQPVPGIFTSGPNTIALTADQVQGANDLEGAIIRATAEGTKPGTVILDGQNGPFVFTGPDKSVNIFVSNLTLRGVNRAVIENCDDGLFFDNFPLQNIRVEGIEFDCTGGGVSASGAFINVTFRHNIFKVETVGIGLEGDSRGWLVTENVIKSGQEGILLSGADRIIITHNYISGNRGISLYQSSLVKVRKNIIAVTQQGILMARESILNLIESNAIRASHAGIVLESDVRHNTVLENRITCTLDGSCVVVEAPPEATGMNTISGNTLEMTSE